MPKVSVVMPVYNVRRFVADAIRSVLAQTFTDFELIIVDDGSTDGSLELCESFTDPRIRIHRQENRGLAGARNAGIRRAVGEYVAFLDSDDAWAPRKLDEHVRHFERAPAVGVSYSQSEFIDEAGTRLGYFQAPKLRDVAPSDVFLRNPVGNGSAPVIRRRALEEIAFVDERCGPAEPCYFDERFRQSEDIECWTRIALRTAWRFEGIGQPLTRYRVNGSGLSAGLAAQLQSWETFVQVTRAYAPDFVARFESRGRAYQLRYLARRAVRMRNSCTAVAFVHRALATDCRILLCEPGRTVVTLLAAYAQAALPRRAYTWLEGLAMARASGAGVRG